MERDHPTSREPDMEGLRVVIRFFLVLVTAPFLLALPLILITDDPEWADTGMAERLVVVLALGVPMLGVVLLGAMGWTRIRRIATHRKPREPRGMVISRPGAQATRERPTRDRSGGEFDPIRALKGQLDVAKFPIESSSSSTHTVTIFRGAEWAWSTCTCQVSASGNACSHQLKAFDEEEAWDMIVGTRVEGFLIDYAQAKMDLKGSAEEDKEDFREDLASARHTLGQALQAPIRAELEPGA